jgi:hypothetical protein
MQHSIIARIIKNSQVGLVVVVQNKFKSRQKQNKWSSLKICTAVRFHNKRGGK